ncbi:Beta-barrel assembly machine subunit BamE OS=Bosea thiooxidans OX=53254 GN=SAMN05660750_01516 PE=4 SV=1 [Bosea thiooxidans]
MGGFAFQSETKGGVTTTTTSTASAGISTREPVLTPEGECSVGASLDPSTRPLPKEIAPGITECELVRLKGARPTDVLIGESGKGQREVQVLYSEPGGREIYMFTDNRLSRIVKPGQG